MPETDPWVDFNIGSDAANSAEEGEGGLSSKDETEGETEKKSNSEESNEGSEKESTDATSSAVDEKEEEEKEEEEKEEQDEREEKEKEEEKTTMRPNTKARWSGKSSSSERLATPLLAILLSSLTLISRF